MLNRIKENLIPNLDDDSKKLFKKWFLFSAVFHLVAVIFSEGFHRPDEHLGMLRYVYFKLGQYPASELSWEFPVMIRNWVQPGFYYLFAKTSYLLGLENPFFITFILRLVSSSIGFFAMYVTALITLKTFKRKNLHQLSFLFMGFLWFFPFIHARATAESFGIYSFIFGFYFLCMNLPEERLNWSKFKLPSFERVSIGLFPILAAGFFIGMAVNFRIPMAPMAALSVIWLVFIARIKWSQVILFGVGVLISIGFTALCDSWGYETWTYSTYNYLYQEFTHNVSKGFGVDPWYRYISKGFAKGTPPLSLIIIVSFIYFWIKKPLHWVTLVSSSFFVLHSLIPHKELRYIFPILIFLPWTMAFLIGELKEKSWYLKFQKGFTYKIIFWIIIVENVIFLVISTTKPAFTPIDFYKSLYYSKEPIEKLHTLHFVRDKLRVYLKGNTPFEFVEKIENVDTIISKSETTWFSMNKIGHIRYFLDNKNCEKKYMTYPEWIMNYEKYLKRSKVRAIFKCKN